MPHTYSVYEAKTHLSEVLRSVKNGAEIVVTERGTPIAKVIPIQKKETLRQRVQRLTTSGHIIPRKIKGPLPLGIKKPGGLKRFLEDRE